MNRLKTLGLALCVVACGAFSACTNGTPNETVTISPTGTTATSASATATPASTSPEDTATAVSPAETRKPGSQGQINIDLGRSDEWKQIVEDKTRFQLGGDLHRDDTIYKGYGTFPKMDGSTVSVPMAMEFVRQFTDVSEKDVENMCMFSTTDQAYENLTGKFEVVMGGYDSFVMDPYQPVDIIIATEPSDEELKNAEIAGVELVTEPVCHDAFVFITHASNPVDSLTIQQVKDIYTGKTTNWKDVGGDDMPIKAYQRTPNSGSQTAMEKLVMGGQPMMEPLTEQISTGMGDLIDAIMEYDNTQGAIGYTYKYYIDNLYENKDVKTLAIEGITPAPDTIRDKTYAYSTYYYGVIRGGEEDEVGGRFLEWMLTDEGQECIEQAGYISLR